MGKSAPSEEFKVFVDGSCLSETTDLGVVKGASAAERNVSNETVIHHDLDSPVVEDASEEVKSPEEEEIERNEREEQVQKLEAQIQAAAKAIVDSTKQGQEEKEEAMKKEQELAEAELEAARVQQDDLDQYDTEVSFSHYDSEHDAGTGSSHHDGDIDDDDVFSSEQSARSSLASASRPSHGSAAKSSPYQLKKLASSKMSDEAVYMSEATMSRAPSGASSFAQISSLEMDELHTPTKTATPSTAKRPPFRTPSSVRAMQMSSPTPSVFFTSPRSTKRQGAQRPSSLSPSKKTPTARFKAKKEFPLVLLHAAVLPLVWSYQDVITSPDLPVELHQVRECWRLLQDKLADTVLDRGILLPHPQDSYELLEERFLETLELPVVPRARILKCGHYMGPQDSEASSDDDASVSMAASMSGRNSAAASERSTRGWCDICGREVRFEETGPLASSRAFRIKVYASNGLMRAGAWSAVWREMERVDVEIEPYVDGPEAEILENFALKYSQTLQATPEDDEDGFVDEEEEEEEEENNGEQAEYDEAAADRERDRLLDELERRSEAAAAAAHDEELKQAVIAEIEAEAEAQAQAEAEAEAAAGEQVKLDIERKLRDEERLREIYGEQRGQPEEARHERDEERSVHTTPARISQHSHSHSHSRSHTPSRPTSRISHTHSYSSASHMHSSHPAHAVGPLPYRPDAGLFELLFAASKVFLRDGRNVAICVLMAIVVGMVIPRGGSHGHAGLSRHELGLEGFVYQQQQQSSLPLQQQQPYAPSREPEMQQINIVAARIDAVPVTKHAENMVVEQAQPVVEIQIHPPVQGHAQNVLPPVSEAVVEAVVSVQREIEVVETLEMVTPLTDMESEAVDAVESPERDLEAGLEEGTEQPETSEPADEELLSETEHTTSVLDTDTAADTAADTEAESKAAAPKINIPFLPTEPQLDEPIQAPDEQLGMKIEMAA